LVFAIGFLSEYRTSLEFFYSALEIKNEYRDLNTGLLWVITYISMPTINIVELTKFSQYFYGEAMLSSALPAFLSFDQGAELFYTQVLPNPYNTVAGYLKNAYLDFGWIGVFTLNLFIGFLLSCSSIYKFSNLSKSVLLNALLFLFFYDYFINFTTIFVIFLFYFFGRLCQRPTRA
jgi:hypothetical protein